MRYFTFQPSLIRRFTDLKYKPSKEKFIPIKNNKNKNICGPFLWELYHKSITENLKEMLSKKHLEDGFFLNYTYNAFSSAKSILSISKSIKLNPTAFCEIIR